MVEVGRRDVLHGFAAVSVSFAIGSYSSARVQGPGGRKPYMFFTPDEAAFVEAAVDRLIPPEPEWPGARAAAVPAYIDLQLAGPYGQGDRLYLKGPIRPGLPGQGYQLGLTPAQLYRAALSAIGDALGARGLDFAAASDPDKDAFLESLEKGGLTIDGFSSAIFFETLLANTIEGYFADPAYGGNKDKTSWRMIGFPGAYAAYADVYTRHGMQFDYPPISMAEVHHHPAPAHGPAVPDARAGR